ncbi:MAG: hypothetical protein M1820_005853 [Bogoriella megaspora]|nr:MAG: hypothetical protein M1820_005853 [Bogoriella megaspora]
MFFHRLCLLTLPLFVSTYPTAELEKRACTAVTVIFARGTTELGTIGTIVGPPFEVALQVTLGSGKLTFEGVPYAATIAGFEAGGDPAGAAEAVLLANNAIRSCPSTQVVLSGYSQGAQVIRKSAPLLSSQARNAAKAVVLFGDPDDGQPFFGVAASKVAIFCAIGDTICAGTSIVIPAHLSYGIDAAPAAAFVRSRVSV